MASQFNEDVYVNGNLAAKTMSIPAGTLTNAGVHASAEIDADKMQHRNYKTMKDDNATTVATRQEVVHVCRAAGSIISFKAGCVDTGSTGDVDFDLKVNGSTVLSGAVNIANTDTNRAVESGTISSPVVAADDVIEISFTRNSSSDATGAFAEVVIDEASV